MSFPYVIYYRASGEIVSSIEAPIAEQRPPEGLWGDWDDTWVKHGRGNPNTDRVRVAKKGKTKGSARIVPKLKAQQANEALARKWFDFRSKRSAFLEATQFMVTGDYPMSDEALAQLKADRQLLRDAPQNMKSDPEGAIELLGQIRSRNGVG